MVHVVIVREGGRRRFRWFVLVVFQNPVVVLLSPLIGLCGATHPFASTWYVTAACAPPTSKPDLRQVYRDPDNDDERLQNLSYALDLLVRSGVTVFWTAEELVWSPDEDMLLLQLWQIYAAFRGIPLPRCHRWCLRAHAMPFVCLCGVRAGVGVGEGTLGNLSLLRFADDARTSTRERLEQERRAYEREHAQRQAQEESDRVCSGFRSWCACVCAYFVCCLCVSSLPHQNAMPWMGNHAGATTQQSARDTQSH